MSLLAGSAARLFGNSAGTPYVSASCRLQHVLAVGVMTSRVVFWSEHGWMQFTNRIIDAIVVFELAATLANPVCESSQNCLVVGNESGVTRVLDGCDDPVAKVLSEVVWKLVSIRVHEITQQLIFPEGCPRVRPCSMDNSTADATCLACIPQRCRRRLRGTLLGLA